MKLLNDNDINRDFEVNGYTVEVEVMNSMEIVNITLTEKIEGTKLKLTQKYAVKDMQLETSPNLTKAQLL